jgi:hypothetical protein
MSAGHLVFALGTIGYSLLGIWFEERDLSAQFGDRYRRYREQVGMLLPRLSKRPFRFDLVAQLGLKVGPAKWATGPRADAAKRAGIAFAIGLTYFRSRR